jgi:predicted O-methyltransferase YrrM
MTVTAGSAATDLTDPLSPDRIMQVGFGFWPSRALLTAVELRLFTVLGRGPATRGQVEGALGIRSRHGADFLDGLVSLGLLDRTGEGTAATYANTAETAAFLDETSPTYVGGILEMAGARLYRFWGGLTEGLLTGEPQNETRHGETPMFEELYRDPDRLEQFMRAMSGLSRPRFQALAEVFDFTRHGSVADIGGAAADLSVVLAERHPHLRLTTFDLPEVAPIATRSVAAAGLSYRVSVAAGDFFRDPLPRADVLTMGMILHDWDLDAKLHLLRAAYEALPPGGALVAVESLIDDARRENTFGLMMSLNMLIEFGGAFDYTGADFDGWCRSVGFSRTEVLPLVGGASAAVAYR